MSAAMQLRVRQFLGIVKADLNLKGIVLVAGRNAAGKSSLLEAASCAFLGVASARGFKTKKDLALLLKRGSEAGSIALDYGPGQLRISYPGGTTEQAGKPEFQGTAVGIGAVKFMSLTVETRLREIADRFKTQPVVEDVYAWFRDHPCPDLDKAAMSTLFDTAHDQGWDATHKAAREHGTKLKGSWENVTGRRFGADIAKTWAPPNLLPGEDYDLAMARESVEAAKKQLEQLVKVEAVTAADLERLTATAAGLDAAKDKVRELEGLEAALSAEIEALIQQQNATDAPVDVSDCPDCPHCGKKVRVTRSAANGLPLLTKAPPAPSAAKTKEIKERIAAIAASLGDTKNRFTALTEERGLARKAMQDAQRAADALRKAQEMPARDTAAIDKQRALVLELERKTDAIAKMKRAGAIHVEWLRQEQIIQAMDADGIRKMVMSRKLAEISDTLGRCAEAAKFHEVTLTDEMDATYDGRRYALLSESERWRVDLVISAVLGKQEGAHILLVDRLDVLDPESRVGPLRMLHGLKMPVLMGMTAKEPATVPNLTKAELGVTHWLERGVLS